MIILAGDIGGTNTRLVIAEREQSNLTILAEKNYASNLYTSFEEVVSLFIADANFNDEIDAACFAIAGPVTSGQSKITNLPWLISEKQLEDRFKLPRVKLINDFMAVALGISWLKDNDIQVIQQGSVLNNKSQPDAAIIGAGTGLGASHRVWINHQYHILPSETGHISFAPANEQQTQLLTWLLKTQQHVSLESILSGGGLYTVYQFLKETNQGKESITVKTEMQNTDPAKVITDYALTNKDELSSKALDMFVEIYGAIAGDVTLHYYPVDELYIAGGIAPKIKNKISSPAFLNSLTNKGLMSENLKNITVKLVLNEKVGLYGALWNA